jgi:nucleoside-diphosphate-sugar epimerase
MRIVVTGASGYLGHHVCHCLLNQDHEVVGVDTDWFGPSKLRFVRGYTPIVGDVRHDATFDAIEGDFDALIYLAAVSNDPSGRLNPVATGQINEDMAVLWARRAYNAGAKRVVFPSSCSIYGGGCTLDIEPLTEYASSKRRAELRLLKDWAGNDELYLKILRLGTLYGPSSRMRFDLTLNLMAKNYAAGRPITITGGGKQIRPFTHVTEAAREICLEATEGPECIRHVVGFNAPVGRLALQCAAECTHGGNRVLKIAPGNPDPRNYHVPADQTFGTKKKAIATFNEMVAQIQNDIFGDPDQARYYTVRVLKEILK